MVTTIWTPTNVTDERFSTSRSSTFGRFNLSDPRSPVNQRIRVCGMHFEASTCWPFCARNLSPNSVTIELLEFLCTVVGLL